MNMHIFKAVRSGVVDLANSTAVFHANLVPEALAMTLTDRSIQELRENGGHELMDQIHQDKANMYWFARVSDGLQYHLYSNKPVDSADLKGFKLRSTPVYLAFFRSLGATSLQISPGETYTALERGVVDGYGWPSVGLLDLGWQEKAKQAEAGVEVITLSEEVSADFLDKADKAGWENLKKVSPANAAEIERLFGKETP